MADRDEQPVGRHVGRLAGADVANPDTGDVALVDAEHVVDDRVQHELDLVVPTSPVDHDGGGPELVPTVDERHPAGELREERRLLHRSVAAADDDDVLVS